MHLLDFSLIFAITLVIAIDVERITEDYSTLPHQREPRSSIGTWMSVRSSMLGVPSSSEKLELSDMRLYVAFEAHPPPEHALISGH